MKLFCNSKPAAPRRLRGIAAFTAAAVLALGLLSGCAADSAAGSASSDAFSSASSGVSAPAASSAVSSAETATAKPSTAPAAPAPSDAPETAPLADSLDTLLGWGPGVAGCSLKSVLSACALLDWAEDNAAAARRADALTAEVSAWLAAQTDDHADNFRETWPGVCGDADTLVKDVSSMQGLLEDAGSPNTHDSYTAAHWEALKAAVNAALDEEPSASEGPAQQLLPR